MIAGALKSFQLIKLISDGYKLRQIHTCTHLVVHVFSNDVVVIVELYIAEISER